jgi:hypothetical protein
MKLLPESVLCKPTTRECSLDDLHSTRESVYEPTTPEWTE